MSSPDDYRWLTSDAAAACLRELAAARLPLHQAAAQLRRTHSPERAHLALQLVELRRRARDKFAAAEQMFFTPLGLEQATDQWIAQHKAARFPSGIDAVDLCCGIGGDLLAIAARGSVTGVDRDPIAAILAEANAGVCGVQVALRVADVGAEDVRSCAAWHLDPDRRPQGRRTSRVEFGSPAQEEIESLLAANPNAALKLAPAADVPEAWTVEAEREWISRDGECRQQVAWFGTLAQQSGQTRATAIRRQGTQIDSFVGRPEISLSVAHAISRYVYEPDAAVLAAELTGDLAASHGLSALEADVAYLTGDELISRPILSCFEVLDVLPLDLKQVRAALRARSVGQLEVKVRGVKQDPAEVLRQLKPEGSASATLLLTRTANGSRAILARRPSS